MRRWWLIFVLLLGAVLPCQATTCLIKVQTQEPFADSLQKLTSLPEFQLMADGTVYYSRPGKELGQVQYYTAVANQDEISSIVSRLQLTGAADWDDSYDAATLKDLPTTTFTFDAPGLSRSLSVYGAAYSVREHQLPEGLSWLIGYVSNYHNSTEKAYVPDHATLFIKHIAGSTKDRDPDRIHIKWSPRIDLDKTTGTSGEYKTLDLSGQDARDAWQALAGVALPTMLAPKVVFTHKRDLYLIAIKPILP